jgi:hypothetical protein
VLVPRLGCCCCWACLLKNLWKLLWYLCEYLYTLHGMHKNEILNKFMTLKYVVCVCVYN